MTNPIEEKLVTEASKLAEMLFGEIQYGDGRDEPNWRSKVVESVANILEKSLREMYEAGKEFGRSNYVERALPIAEEIARDAGFSAGQKVGEEKEMERVRKGLENWTRFSCGHTNKQHDEPDSDCPAWSIEDDKIRGVLLEQILNHLLRPQEEEEPTKK